MRKKANPADIDYIVKHSLDKSINELSEELDLSYIIVKDYWVDHSEAEKEARKEELRLEAEAKKKPKLGRSKIKLNGGASVYQLTDDIIPERNTAKKQPIKELDAKNGIFRG